MSSKIDLNKFRNTIPKELEEFSAKLNEWGYVLTLVGGAVRDFSLYETLSKDLDFEVRSLDLIEDEKWEGEFKNLSTRISDLDNTKVEVLRFNIIRVNYKGLELEISSPRVEVYDQKKNNFGHSDFTVRFSSNYTYEESFSRRDFTINSLGIEFGDELKFIDPFNGLEDIESKTLNFITDDFFKDPVRFLRALRFKVAHRLELARRLKDDLVYFNLDKLSLHYFKQEGAKIGLEKLVFEMDFARRKFSSKLPSWASQFHEIAASNLSPCANVTELLMNYAIQPEAKLEVIQSLGEDLSLKKSLIKSIAYLRSIYQINLKEFKDVIQKLSFQEVTEKEEFIAICKIHKEFEKLPKEVLDFFLSKETIKILGMPIEKDSLYREILPTISKSQISMLGIYCHLIKLL